MQQGSQIIAGCPKFRSQGLDAQPPRPAQYVDAIPQEIKLASKRIRDADCRLGKYLPCIPVPVESKTHRGINE
jgi:hypothetical protein